MNADAVIAKYEKRQPEIAAEWLAPLDARLAKLIDASERMTVGAFQRLLAEEAETVASLFDELNADALQQSLEEAIGEAIIAAL